MRMGCRYEVACERSTARRVEALAREYDLTTEEVLLQLVEIGLEELDDE